MEHLVQSSPLSALAQYKILPQISGGLSMIMAVAARAPYAMIPLGTMTAITASTGSVATGGLATAFTSIAAAIASPLIGRWADHMGQRFVLSLLTPISAISLGLLLMAALQGWTGPVLWLLCLAVGATSLPIGAFTRARWIHFTRNPKELSAALSYESTVDELVFVLGPAFVGIAASMAAPAAPLGVAMALVIVGGLPFAITAPTASEIDDAVLAEDSSVTRPSILRVLWAVVPAIVIMLSIGTFFGSVQAATTERALELGSPGQAGLVYALMGLGSAFMALMVVVIPDSVRISTRVLIGGAGMAGFILLAMTQDSLTTTALALLVTGLFVGPTMVTAFTITERLSPAGGTAVAMTSMQSSITIGVSLGSAVGGAIAVSGATGAFAMAAAAAGVVLVTGLIMSFMRPEREPVAEAEKVGIEVAVS
ncbi:MFS transporter [Actinomycetaceae bacterium L2_0104]